MLQVSIEKFEIIEGYENTAVFLDQICDAADAHRNALGFFPSSVYGEFARSNNLYVIIEKSSERSHYAGHLLFDRRHPRAHVRQMFTSPKYRRLGLASKLIKHFCNSLTGEGFTSIYARVAEDLEDSNVFWERHDFFVQRVEEGRGVRKRKILVRCHELESPQLFPTRDIGHHNPLGLEISRSNAIPLFLLDLNVLFDTAKPRRKLHAKAVSLFQAERMSFCRLAISDEIREELRRTAQNGKTDPMLGYINIFPSFPLLKHKGCDGLVKSLASVVFPDKQEKSQLNANDWSDLRHLATVIQNDLAGLITNDGSILEAAPQIKDKYRIEVLSPDAFMLDEKEQAGNTTYETLTHSTLSLLDVSESHELSVRSLLSSLDLSGSDISAGWLPTTTAQGSIAMRYAVWDKDTIIGYITWSKGNPVGSISARIAVDETNRDALNAARILLIYMLEQQTSHGPRKITLALPHHQPHVRELATEFGFRGTPNHQYLTKLVLGRVLTTDTWSIGQKKLVVSSGVKLPISSPEYNGVNQQIEIFTPNGNKTYVALDFLETLLSPALLCLNGRPAVITPVQKSFSDPLLGCSPQKSLLPLGSASLFQERHYISSDRTLKHFKKGTLILFYESTKGGGRAEIIAIARVRQAYHKPADLIDSTDLEQSVLTYSSLTNIGKSDIKTVTVFDNIFPLPRPVSMKFLKRLGCGRPNDLITTKPITVTHMQAILREGFNRA